MSVSNVTSVDSYFSIRLDQISDTLLYIGEGNLGADESSPVWSIKKMEQMRGGQSQGPGQSGYVRFVPAAALIFSG